MSTIRPVEIDVTKLAIHVKDRQKVMRTLWRPGEFLPHEDLSFVKKFITVKDPIEVARRARAYVSVVNVTHKTDTVYTPDYAIIANQLFAVGFNAQQVHDISFTKMDVPVLENEELLHCAGGLYD